MFKDIKKPMQEAFALMLVGQQHLFITDLDKDKIWETYLNSYPDAGVKQEHNCSACRHFLKNYANIVAIHNNQMVTMWDFITTPEFEMVVNNMKRLVSNSTIKDIFVSDMEKLGVDQNIQRIIADIETRTITWEHFHLKLPKQFVNRSLSSREAVMGEARDNKNVFKRSLDEITQDSVETVLELIAQNSLYKGEESKGLLEQFLKHKKAYAKCANKDNYCWEHASKVGGALAKIRNTSIGTLLVEISEGKELDVAVASFERMVAPANYKRPTAIVTKRMIEDAEKTIKELGYEESLERRYAEATDISVNNLLFVNRNVKKAMGVFNEMKEDVVINPKSLKKVEEITIDDFIQNILPKATNIELLFENGHLNNLMSLITEKNEKAPILFKWNNPFSWNYTNAVTDSIKERVKQAGGKVDGDLRFSIQWNEDGKSIIDLDAHAHEPGGKHIYYSSGYRKDRGNEKTPFGGQLDVDMISPRHTGVENIAWASRVRMKDGVYKLRVHNFSGHKSFDGVRCEVEFDGEIHEFAHNKPFTNFLDVAEVTYSVAKGFSVKPLLDSKTSINTKEKWGISTNKFYKVAMIMPSPNYWSENTGNKHTFFIIEGAKCDEPVRGFFNEFLKDELSKNKRVFEVLGGKLKVEPADKQLSGVGFSSTQRNSVICRVEGKFERLLKINF